MKRKGNNLEKNISRLVKLAGDSNKPSEAFTDSLAENALGELKQTAAGRKREEKDKFMKTKWPKIFAYAASIIIVCGVAIALTVPKLARVRKYTYKQSVPVALDGKVSKPVKIEYIEVEGKTPVVSVKPAKPSVTQPVNGVVAKVGNKNEHSVHLKYAGATLGNESSSRFGRPESLESKRAGP